MRIAPIALVWLLSASALAVAAEPTPPNPPLPLPDLAPPATDAAEPSARDAAAKPHAQDQPKPRTDATHRSDPPRGRLCFNASETREKIATHRLTDPVRALRAGRLQGEALRARLCRWKADEFVYEISVLRRDGRLVRIFMNAQTGQAVGALNDSEHK